MIGNEEDLDTFKNAEDLERILAPYKDDFKTYAVLDLKSDT